MVWCGGMLVGERCVSSWKKKATLNWPKEARVVVIWSESVEQLEYCGVTGVFGGVDCMVSNVPSQLGRVNKASGHFSSLCGYGRTSLILCVYIVPGRDSPCKRHPTSCGTF